jgi:hypothetical protein
VELTLQDVSMFNDSRALPDAYATSYEGACGYAIDGDPLPVLCALGDVVAENVSIEDPLDVGIMVDGGSLTSGDADGGREGGLVLAGASHARALVVTTARRASTARLSTAIPRGRSTTRVARSR